MTFGDLAESGTSEEGRGQLHPSSCSPYINGCTQVTVRVTARWSSHHGRRSSGVFLDISGMMAGYSPQ